MQQNLLIVPDRFEAKQELWTVGLDMELLHNGNTFGKVIQRMSFGNKFELTDMSGRIVAVAKERVFKLGVCYDITTPQGDPIGTF